MVHMGRALVLGGQTHEWGELFVFKLILYLMRRDWW